MKKKCSFILLILSFFALQPSFLGATGDKRVEIKTIADLKDYMYKFASLISGLEVLRVKKDPPDWPEIAHRLDDMSRTLKGMQKADTINAYKYYTDQLAKQLTEVRRFNRKKDPQIFDRINQMTRTCFQCHSAHRPPDFHMPKNDVGMN